MKLEWAAREIGEITGRSKRAITIRANRERWGCQKVTNHKGGGKKFVYRIGALPADIQKEIISKSEEPPSLEEIEDLCPEAQLEAYRKMVPTEQFSFAGDKRKALLDPQQSLLDQFFPPQKHLPIGPDVLEDDRVGDLVQIIQEAQSPPPGCNKTKWVKMVAIKYGKNPATIYRYLQKHGRAGLAGLKHRKSTRGQPRAWTPEAIDFWLGLCLKREHRHTSKAALYECLVYEAAKRGWRIGGKRTAYLIFNERIPPQLLALQRGGVRALDNTLPPICRDYSDLKPFEILVGDQHRFDFWVVDEESGEVFRPEGYFWQDLRTRSFYGGAVDKHYNAYLMGLALRIGIRRFGPFGSIYTDRGKPEEAHYIKGLLKRMRALGLGAEETIDIPVDVSEADPEEMGCRIAFPNEHIKAIVRNAKAKMMESTNRAMENILRNELKLPGNTKRLTASQEEQEIDQKEAEKLARAGKLLTFREFALGFYRAMDFYNDKKPHRGVLREWLWDPKPKQATPMQCLKMCYSQDGWRPARLPEEAVEAVFLPRERRVVDRGRITVNKERYEHEALILLNGQRVEAGYDPLDPSWIMVWFREEFLCRAELLEYSSMKDRDLAERKIREKARRRKIFTEQYKKLTFRAPDFREYSRVPAAERAAAVIGRAKREALKRKAEEAEFYRDRTEEELDAEIKQVEDRRRKAEEARARSPQPSPRPKFFPDAGTRFRWCMEQEFAGFDLCEDDHIFRDRHWATLSEGARRYWEMRREFEAESREAAIQKAIAKGK